MINPSPTTRSKAIENCIHEYVRMPNCSHTQTGVEVVLCLPSQQYMYMQTLNDIISPHPAMVYTYFLWIRYSGINYYSKEHERTGLYSVWYATHLHRVIHDE